MKEDDYSGSAAAGSLQEQEAYLKEWFDACTIGRCLIPTRSYFAKRGRIYFKKCAAELMAHRQVADIYTEGERAWLIFEEYMCTAGKNDRKAYKEGMLEHAAKHDQADARVIHALAYIKRSFKTVVRQWVTKEGGHGRNSKGLIVASHIEATGPDADGEEGASYLDFLPANVPDPSDEAGQALLQHAVADACAAVIAKMNDPMRVALAAKAYGVSLAHQEVVKKAGRKSTQLAFYLQEKKGVTSGVNLPAWIREEAIARLPDADMDQHTAFRAALLHGLLIDNNCWLERPENEEFLRFLREKGSDQL